jgi:hypothetical protein
MVRRRRGMADSASDYTEHNLAFSYGILRPKMLRKKVPD